MNFDTMTTEEMLAMLNADAPKARQLGKGVVVPSNTKALVINELMSRPNLRNLSYEQIEQLVNGGGNS
jgi:hypothetical protein